MHVPRSSYSILVARHLSDLTISPTYMHPQYQYMDSSDGEYANELQYLTSGRSNPGDGGYWENTRNEAVRYLTEAPSRCAKQHRFSFHESLIFYLSSNYNHSQQDLSTMWQTGYQPSEFAQSIFQHTLSSMPYTYPTPPPGIAHSSSSLANALQEQPRPQRKVYEPETSAQFFNEFISNKTKDLPVATPSFPTPAPPTKPPMLTPPATIPPVTSGSAPSRVQTPVPALRVTEPQAMTPRKRKHEDTESSVPKPQHPHQTPANPPVFPRKDFSSLPRIPKKSQVYVEVPPRPTWKGQAPASQPPATREPPSTTDVRFNDVHSTTRPNAQSFSMASTVDGRTSPTKRTGGRDDRGDFLMSCCFEFF